MGVGLTPQRCCWLSRPLIAYFMSLGIHLVKLSSLDWTLSPACPSWVFYVPLPFPCLGPLVLQVKKIFSF